MSSDFKYKSTTHNLPNGTLLSTYELNRTLFFSIKAFLTMNGRVYFSPHCSLLIKLYNMSMD